MKEIILRRTQGNQKLRQHLDDLLRNKHFMKAAAQFMTAYKDKPSDDYDIHNLLDEYKKLDQKAQKYLKKHYLKLDTEMNKIAEEYGLDMELLRPVIMSSVLTGKENKELKEWLLYGGCLDMCFLVDNNDEQLNPAFPPLPFVLDTRKQDHIKAFPISIDIHRFATKRDVLDYIRKEWPRIEGTLNIYREYKNIKFRKRKFDRKLLDFIWDNRTLNKKRIIESLDQNFPNHGLVYFEIYKLISLENKRRNQKLT